MKIYKFYLYKKAIRHTKYPAISDDNIFETSSGKYACLYAYTDSKDIRDEFIEYRNMNIFKLKTENMSKDEYEQYQEAYPDELLEYSSFGTSSVVDDNIKITPVTLVVTNKESTTIFCDYDMIAEGSLYDVFSSITNDKELFDSIVNFPNIFKHEISEALDYMEFVNVMLEYFSPESAELPFKVFAEDKLIAYVKLFGNTYKSEVLL